MKKVLLLVSLMCAAGCSGDDDDERDPDQPFGDTAIVAVVNPVVNDANTTAVPVELGSERDGLVLDAEPGGSDTTDATGLAVLGELDVGLLALQVESVPPFPMTITSSGDVHDIAIAYSGTAATPFLNFPIRYGVGGTILEFASDADPAEIQDALAGNGNIVFFRNGVFTGDLTITGDDVVFFGEGFTESQVVIDGSVLVNGTGVRIRGFTITGNLTAPGNDFGMAWSVVQGTTDVSGNAAALLRNGFCSTVEVPSSDASVLDNEGMPPLPAPSTEDCSR